MTLLLLYHPQVTVSAVSTGVVDFELPAMPTFVLEGLPGIKMRAIPSLGVGKLDLGLPSFLTNTSGVWLQDANSAGILDANAVNGKATVLPALPTLKVDE